MRRSGLLLSVLVWSPWLGAQTSAISPALAPAKNASTTKLPPPAATAPAAAPRRIPSTPMPTTGPGRTVLYSARWCGYCTQAKQYLARHKIAYQEVDIDTPRGKAAFAKIKADGIPVLMIDERRVDGFTDATYDFAFALRTSAQRR